MVLKLHSTTSTLREAGGESPPQQPPPSLILPRHAFLNNGDRYVKHPRTFSTPSLCLPYEHAAKVEGNPSRFWLPSAMNGAGEQLWNYRKRLPVPWKFQVVVSPRLQAIGLVCCKGGGYLKRQSPASTATSSPMLPDYLAWQVRLAALRKA